MKAKKVWALKGRTLHLGDHNFAKFEYGIEVEVEEDEKALAAHKYANEYVDRLLNEEQSRIEEVYGPVKIIRRRRR